MMLSAVMLWYCAVFSTNGTLIVPIEYGPFYKSYEACEAARTFALAELKSKGLDKAVTLVGCQPIKLL